MSGIAYFKSLQHDLDKSEEYFLTALHDIKTIVIVVYYHK